MTTHDTDAIHLHYQRVVDSTQDLALAAAHAGAPPGTAFAAEVQLKGRGRRVDGDLRAWIAPPGSSILLSVLLRPRLPLRLAPSLTLAAGVAAAEILRDATGLPIGLKWPNDLYLRDRKLGGVLAEAATTPDGHLDALVIGIGINVNLPIDALPTDLHATATSLLVETGRPWDRLDLIGRLVPALLKISDQMTSESGRADVFARWEALSIVRGRPVEFIHDATWRRGEALGIDAEGALQVRLDDGATATVRSGELRWHLR